MRGARDLADFHRAARAVDSDDGLNGRGRAKRDVAAVTAHRRPEMAGQQLRTRIDAPLLAGASHSAMDTGDYWLDSIGLLLVVAVVVLAG
jgi:hypothetical protein